MKELKLGRGIIVRLDNHRKKQINVPIVKEIPQANAAPTTPKFGNPKLPLTSPIKRKTFMIFFKNVF